MPQNPSDFVAPTRGVFVLSIDLELAWGTFDHGSYPIYRTRFDRVRPIARALLELLARYRICATWAIVGHLFLDRCQRQNGVAHPELVRTHHDWYPGDWLSMDPCSNLDRAPHWYGRDLVEQIAHDPTGHEIGSHSFSHVIFADRSCSCEAARSELEHCVRAAREALGRELKSFVFPRNAPGHLDELANAGFRVYRGPDPWWFNRLPLHWLRRLGHFADDLFMIPPSVRLPRYVDPPGIWNVQGSMLYQSRHGLRRWIPIVARVRKAKRGIRTAIAERKVFHLWFHPFNLADDEAKLLAGLDRILAFAAGARDRGELDILTMGELADRCEQIRTTTPSKSFGSASSVESSQGLASRPCHPAVGLHNEQADLFEQRYRLLERDYHESAFTYGRRQVDRIVDAWLGKAEGQRLLDVGCGTGFHLARWKKLGFDCIGIEPAPAMLARAHAQTDGCGLVGGDAERLPFADAQFDVVTSIEVLRYLSVPEAYFAEIYRVLRPGGVCIVTAAPRYSLHGFSLAHRLSRFTGAGRFGRVRHRFDTARSLKRLCRQAGFDEIDIRGAFLGPFVLSEKIAPRLSTWTLRRWEPVDVRLASVSLLRNVCNHLVVRAVK